MKKDLKNKIKAGLILFIVDSLTSLLTINLLGYSFDFTQRNLGIIAVVNLVALFALSFFKLIEDGK